MDGTVEDAVLCVLCPREPREAGPGHAACTSCMTRLAADLELIARRFGELTAVPGTTGTGGRRAPGFASKPPPNMHSAALRDPRTAPSRPGELHSPVHLMLSWALELRRLRGQKPVAYPPGADVAAVIGEARYLLASMDWISRQGWVSRFRDEVRAVRSQLLSALGERPPRKVGRCRRWLGAVDGPPEQCADALFPPREGSRISTCRRCGHAYDLLDMALLLDAQSGDRPT